MNSNPTGGEKLPQVKLVFSMSYIPKNMKGNIKGRSLHSCLLIEEGMYEYTFEGRNFVCGDGSVIYIPKASVYQYKILTESAKCVQIEFDVLGDVNWSKYPAIIKNKVDSKRAIREIERLSKGSTSADYFAYMAMLYRLCDILSKEFETVKKPTSTIQPAVEYIENHHTEKINTATLAELCFMSQSQLRRRFDAEYKMSPITYKNRYTVNIAKSMLLYNVMTVGEIAEILGFDNVYAFSAMFKKYASVSPMEFKKRGRTNSKSTL